MPACRQIWSVIGSGRSVQSDVVVFEGKTVVLGSTEVVVEPIVVVGTDVVE